MIKQLKDIINAHSDKNYDLRSLLARAYLNNQDIKEAERIYRQLAKESEDESLVGIYKEIRSIAREYRGNPEYSDISLMNNREFEELSLDDWRPQEIITVKRDKPKVGRNDPCPCGSGKKYKKCCMGKGIY
jgi:preprotein translocase subunit SecA